MFSYNNEKSGIEQIPFVVNTLIFINIVSTGMVLGKGVIGFVEVLVRIYVIYHLYLGSAHIIKALKRITGVFLCLYMYYGLMRHIPPIDATLGMIGSFLILGLLTGKGSKLKAIVLGIIPFVILPIVLTLANTVLEHKIAEHEVFYQKLKTYGKQDYYSMNYKYEIKVPANWRIITRYESDKLYGQVKGHREAPAQAEFYIYLDNRPYIWTVVADRIDSVEQVREKIADSNKKVRENWSTDGVGFEVFTEQFLEEEKYYVHKFIASPIKKEDVLVFADVISDNLRISFYVEVLEADLDEIMKKFDWIVDSLVIYDSDL